MARIDDVKDAIRKDFHDLYKKEYSTNYKAERMLRDIEIGIMDFENLMELIRNMEC